MKQKQNKPNKLNEVAEDFCVFVEFNSLLHTTMLTSEQWTVRTHAECDSHAFGENMVFLYFVSESFLADAVFSNNV